MLGTERSRQRRVCAARIAALDLPAPLQLAGLKKTLELQRGREIWVLPDRGELPPEITGLWVGASTRDYAYYPAGMNDCPLDNTLLHEFMHMVCNHRSASVQDQAWLRERATNLTSVGDVEHMCMRRNYASPDEQEAELMAGLILARADRGSPARAGASRQEERTAARVESIFRA